MKILIPVDGSVYSDNAVAFVASRTTLIGHEPHIVLLNVQAPLPARASRLVSREALDDYYKDESEKAFKPARKILKKAKMAAEEIAKVGTPAEEIAKVAEEMKADLLIMGSHGRSALKGLLFGSVTNRMIADLLAAQGIKVEHSRSKVDPAIKTLGKFEVDVKLLSDVAAKLSVWVVRG